MNDDDEREMMNDMMNKKYYNTIYILVVGIIWNTPWKKTERLTIELFIPSVERMISRVANKKKSRLRRILCTVCILI